MSHQPLAGAALNSMWSNKALEIKLSTEGSTHLPKDSPYLPVTYPDPGLADLLGLETED
jgi:hypothetical protein